MAQRKTSKFHSSNKRKESQFFSAGRQTSPTYWNINISHASSLTRQRNSTFTESHGSHHAWLHHSFCSLGATLLCFVYSHGFTLRAKSYWPRAATLLPDNCAAFQALVSPFAAFSLWAGAKCLLQSQSRGFWVLARWCSGGAGTKCEWITQYIAGGQ